MFGAGFGFIHFGSWLAGSFGVTRKIVAVSRQESHQFGVNE
jgi:hypothetical protein